MATDHPTTETTAAEDTAGRWATDSELAATGGRRPPAVVGRLELVLPDGRVLTDVLDLKLAWQWAEVAHGPEGWAGLTYGQQCATVAEALAELRRAADAGETTPTTDPDGVRVVRWEAS